VDWQKPQDVVDTFGSKRVDILKNDRVCIDIAGNHLRVILKINYGWSIGYVRWIGWHKDYDSLGNAGKIVNTSKLVSVELLIGLIYFLLE